MNRTSFNRSLMQLVQFDLRGTVSIQTWKPLVGVGCNNCCTGWTWFDKGNNIIKWNQTKKWKVKEKRMKVPLDSNKKDTYILLVCRLNCKWYMLLGGMWLSAGCHGFSRILVRPANHPSGSKTPATTFISLSLLSRTVWGDDESLTSGPP